MDNNESKPQQTGGLKLMTVFIAVLALHVLVIGGFTVYHLMGSGSDADTALDKTHKLKADGTAIVDTAAPDAATPDKAADATATTDAAALATTGTTTTASSTGTDATGTSTASTTAPAAAPASTGTTTAASTQVATNPSAAPVEDVPATPAVDNGSPNSPILVSADDMAQASTIPVALIPPPDATPALNTPAVAPVQNPPAPATVAVTKTAAPAVVPSPTPAKVETLKPAPSVASTGATSVPVIAPTTVASVTAHTPANPPQLATTTVGASHDEKTPVVAPDEHSAAPVREAKKETYTVKITDSYQKIAKAHHITVAQLKAANHIKDNTLHTGQKLVIPAGKTEVAKGEKLHDTSTDKTASVASAPASGAKSHHQVYTVAKGDTLKKIAKKFDVTSSALEKANDLKGTKVAVGEKLRIPSHDVRKTDSVTRVVAAPAVVPAPAPVQPSQVQAQPAPVVQPEPTPMAAPEPVPQPSPAPASNPALVDLTF